VDILHSGIHAGSIAVREFIEEHEPELVVCGHIHEARGVDAIGKSTIVNCGPLFKGSYALIETGPEIRVKLQYLPLISSR
jgi:Icc-related predicted phosphoesterase